MPYGFEVGESAIADALYKIGLKLPDLFLEAGRMGLLGGGGDNSVYIVLNEIGHSEPVLISGTVANTVDPANYELIVPFPLPLMIGGVTWRDLSPHNIEEESLPVFERIAYFHLNPERSPFYHAWARFEGSIKTFMCVLENTGRCGDAAPTHLWLWKDGSVKVMDEVEHLEMKPDAMALVLPFPRPGDDPTSNASVARLLGIVKRAYLEAAARHAVFKERLIPLDESLLNAGNTTPDPKKAYVDAYANLTALGTGKLTGYLKTATRARLNGSTSFALLTTDGDYDMISINSVDDKVVGTFQADMMGGDRIYVKLPVLLAGEWDGESTCIDGHRARALFTERFIAAAQENFEYRRLLM